MAQDFGDDMGNALLNFVTKKTGLGDKKDAKPVI